MNRNVISGIALLSGIVFGLPLTGCSSQPTLAEQMMEQSSTAANLAKQWEKGSETLSKGEKLLKQGNELIEDSRVAMRKGEDKVSEGKNMIEDSRNDMSEVEKKVSQSTSMIQEGKQMMAESERQYKLKFPNASVK